ncbi:MAG: pyruvate kinase [Eggerthellaceae bacterium]|nr:pyruvate kinase [Eggerthellaceae bacterium]
MDRRTKIICTIGPSVDNDEMVRKLIEAGMNVARLNFSHGTHEGHAKSIERIKRIREELNLPISIMLDTKGPEIRTGLLEDGKPVELHEGNQIVLTLEECEGNADRVQQSAEQLPQAVKPKDRILLDDGLIELEVQSVGDDGDITCKIMNSGTLGEHKSINVPGVSVELPAITEQDKKDLIFGIEHGVDYVAASFVRDGEAGAEIRSFLADNGGENIRIISKIENSDAVNNMRDILAKTDAVMVARGDLGVEVPEYRVPHIQKKIIHACNRASKPVITATQMLDSMIRNPRPTRAEVADVANAIYDGTDCVMLSGETAMGKYPIEAVKTLVHIAKDTEEHLLEEYKPDRVRTHTKVSLAVGIAAVDTAEKLGVKCIVTPTLSGRTARLISNLRPKMPIYAVTPFPNIQRQMQLSWGVTPLLGDVCGDMSSVVANAQEAVLDNGIMEPGDITVITCGDPNTAPEEQTSDHPYHITQTNVMYVVKIKDQEAAASE